MNKIKNKKILKHWKCRRLQIDVLMKEKQSLVTNSVALENTLTWPHVLMMMVMLQIQDTQLKLDEVDRDKQQLQSRYTAQAKEVFSTSP